jgi:hypothetical protein
MDAYIQPQRRREIASPCYFRLVLLYFNSSLSLHKTIWPFTPKTASFLSQYWLIACLQAPVHTCLRRDLVHPHTTQDPFQHERTLAPPYSRCTCHVLFLPLSASFHNIPQLLPLTTMNEQYGNSGYNRVGENPFDQRDDGGRFNNYATTSYDSGGTFFATASTTHF